MKMNHIRMWIAVLATSMITGVTSQAASYVTIKEGDNGQYHVTFGGKPFTTLHTKEFTKPILYPIIGPHGIRMTRDYPMKEGTAEERKDHPHHQSLWFTHGDVNGISFWHLGKNTGKIVTTKVLKVQNQGASARITFDNKWVDSKDKTVCTDTQTLTFHKYYSNGKHDFAAIDYEVTLHASEGDVTFGDTKEGSMGIRSHAALRINKGASAVNSEGVTGGAVWGKRAKWVDYSATIDGNVVGFGIFDHPSNPRHPTWWHARDYGLVAANAFGVSNFEGKPKGTGNLKIAKGEKVTFKYRFIFHEGDAKGVDIETRYNNYSTDKPML